MIKYSSGQSTFLMRREACRNNSVRLVCHLQYSRIPQRQLHTFAIPEKEVQAFTFMY